MSTCTANAYSSVNSAIFFAQDYKPTDVLAANFAIGSY